MSPRNPLPRRGRATGPRPAPLPMALAALLLLTVAAPAAAAPAPAPQAHALVVEYLATDGAGANAAAAALTRTEGAAEAVVAAFDEAPDDGARLALLDLLHLVGAGESLADLHRWLLFGPSPRVASRVAQILAQVGDAESATVLAAASTKCADAGARGTLVAALRLVRQRHPSPRQVTVVAVAPPEVRLGQPFTVSFVAYATEPVKRVGAALVVPAGLKLLSEPPRERRALLPAGTEYVFELVADAAPTAPLVLKLSGAWEKRATFVEKAGVRFEADPTEPTRLHGVALTR